MSYRLRIRLAAEADVAEAAQWYNERQLGLGEKFVREVDQAIVRILENPLAFPVILRRHELREMTDQETVGLTKTIYNST